MGPCTNCGENNIRVKKRGLCTACYLAARRWGNDQLPRIAAKVCERCGSPRTKNSDGKRPPPGLCRSCWGKDNNKKTSKARRA